MEGREEMGWGGVMDGLVGLASVHGQTCDHVFKFVY